MPDLHELSHRLADLAQFFGLCLLILLGILVGCFGLFLGARIITEGVLLTIRKHKNKEK